MTLVDEGRVSTLDPVEKFLPSSKAEGEPARTRAGLNCSAVTPARPVNLLDLMTHASGLPGSAPAGSAAPATLTESVARVSRATLLFEPGTEWNYSNIGIAALGRVIEVVSGKSFEQFMAERIFEPLAMKERLSSSRRKRESRRASIRMRRMD